MGRRRLGSGEGEDEGAEAGALGLVKRAEDGLGVVDGEEGEGDGDGDEPTDRKPDTAA